MLSLLLLGALLLLVLACLVLLVRRNNASTSANATEIPVLHERLSARDAEIGQMQQQLAELRNQLHQERAAAGTMRDQLARQDTLLQQERGQHQEKILLLQNAREQMSLEFRNLANEILEQKGKTFSETSRQHITDLLRPLGEKIQLFEKKVEDTYGKEAQQRFALEKEIRALLELNARISVDAVNLTNALKGESKTQGIWGEVILERVLEKSGLQKGREYDIQVSLKDASGRIRQPDVLVHLPENKDVIIDSKVSLTAYEGYFSAADDEARGALLKQHIQSIRNHIRELSGKNYQQLKAVRSLDYVLLFLPVEAAFTLAIQEDDRLFTEAFEQNIILVGPSTLLATLRTIQNIWRYEYQNKNALEIASRAGLMYDKFVTFAQDLEKIGERLGQTQKAYDQAHNKLSSGRGNLASQVEKLKTLGARASKKLPEQWLDDRSEDDSLALPAADEDDVAIVPQPDENP
jgi:DNA recombination protein RmuC